MAIRIAFIGSRGYPYVYSGYETLVKELSEHLIQRNFQVTVYNHQNLFDDRPKIINGINLVYIPTIESKNLSQFIHSFLSVLHACSKKYEVIFVVNAANGPFGIFLRLFGKKSAINVDGLEWQRPKWKGLGQRYFYWAAKMATRFYDVVITDSLEMQQIYKREFACDSTFIAYGAHIGKPKDTQLIKKWNLEKRQYYLIVGRLIPDNNADWIIREFLRTNSERKLVIVGDVSYRDRYVQKIKNVAEKRLLFLGYVRDRQELAELYNHCCAYLHGHQYGGTNPALLEALANGCAICALDTAFNRETLANGDFGLFFSKKENDLTKMIHTIERNPGLLEALRKKAPERVIEKYTWERIANQYIQLFQNMSENL